MKVEAQGQLVVENKNSTQDGANDNVDQTVKTSLDEPVKKEGKEADTSNTVSNPPSTKNLSEGGAVDGSQIGSQAGSQIQPVEGKNADNMQNQNAVGSEAIDNVKNQSAEVAPLNEPSEKKKIGQKLTQTISSIANAMQGKALKFKNMIKAKPTSPK